MRKWIVLMAVFLLVMVAGPAQALDISMTNDNPQYWGWMTVTYDGFEGDEKTKTVGAGRFYTTVYDGEKEIDTFSYCVELGDYFYWNTRYTADVSQPNGPPLLDAAWLVSQFDPLTGSAYLGASLTDGESRSIAMTLQLAIWETLYGAEFSSSAGDADLFGEMIGSLDNIGSFDGSGFFVAKIVGQDQLVANPVPEPATMLLMGIGLLGLGVVGRKRIK